MWLQNDNKGQEWDVNEDRCDNIGSNMHSDCIQF